MKYLAIIISALIQIHICLSQNSEPLQHQFTIDGYQKYISTVDTNFIQHHIIKGWHWCQGKSMSQNLGCSQAHSNNPDLHWDINGN